MFLKHSQYKEIAAPSLALQRVFCLKTSLCSVRKWAVPLFLRRNIRPGQKGGRGASQGGCAVHIQQLRTLRVHDQGAIGVGIAHRLPWGHWRRFLRGRIEQHSIQNPNGDGIGFLRVLEIHTEHIPKPKRLRLAQPSGMNQLLVDREHTIQAG